MAIIDATRVRPEWVAKTLEELGTMTRLANRLGVPPSTASRWIEPGREATGRFIGAVLNNFAITFEEAFMTVRFEVPDEKVRLRRINPTRAQIIA